MHRSFRLSFLLELQNMPSHDLEPLFDDLAEKRVPLISRSRGNLRPILRLQSLDRGRKEITLFHGHMTPFMLDEVANDVVDSLAQQFPIS